MTNERPCSRPECYGIASYGFEECTYHLGERLLNEGKQLHAEFARYKQALLKIGAWSVDAAISASDEHGLRRTLCDISDLIQATMKAD